MQGLADVVALDLSRNLNGHQPRLGLHQPSQAMADASRDRNKQHPRHHRPPSTPELGTINPTTGAFVPLPTPATVPTAVRVNASHHRAVSLFGVASFRGSGGAPRWPPASPTAAA